jgi:hypothetical protein
MSEHRICWSASSNASFRGATDWEPWEEDGDPADVLSGGSVSLPIGLEIALEACGFDWWVETRESAEENA